MNTADANVLQLLSFNPTTLMIDTASVQQLFESRKYPHKKSMSELSKYIKSESVTLNRSEIKFADYNPRTISDEALKTLRKGIRKYGLVGGIVVNKQTGNTLVQGHQRLTVMDDLQKYDPADPSTDYTIRCDLINIDQTAEKELVILLNNPNAQGEWDYDKLRSLIPDIDYKSAGLNEADLSMIGVDFMMPAVGTTEVESNITQLLMPDMVQPAAPTPRVETTQPQKAEMTQEEKIQHMKDVKEQVKQIAAQRAADQSAYVMLSFDNWTNLQDFLLMLDLPAETQIIKGEELATMFSLYDEDEETKE